MKVVELFKSIEGEGIRTGYVCTFVRLFGCNCKCVYCDSLYAIEGKYSNDYPDMTIQEIVDKCKEFKTPYVTLTGGEPLLQKDIHKLILSLILNGFYVNIETNGAVDIDMYRQIVCQNVLIDNWDKLFFTIDYKSISSGCNKKMIPQNFTSNLRDNDVVKFVVGTQEDMEDMRRMVEIIRTYSKCQIFVSPIFGMIEPKDIVEYLKNNDMFDVRCQLQIHKFIYPSDARGV